MERTAQSWAAGELLGPSSPPRFFLEDGLSLSEARKRVQFKKSMGTIE